MIIKGIEHQGIENITVAEFGNGDIGMGVLESINKETCAVVFRNGEKGEIGVHSDRKFGQPEILFTFSNTESLDVVIYILQKCKKLMLSNQLQKSSEN